MKERISDAVAVARAGVWHLRTGGPAQLAEFVRRRRRTGWRPPLLFKVAGGKRRFAPWRWPDASPRRPLRVGVIADDFTRASFRYEWQQVELSPTRFVEQLDGLDLVFVESAWAGNGKAWQYHLTGPSAPRPAVVALAQACRERGIPTVFWNKEDPTHFEDFWASARLFDWVFTTDEECVASYRERLGHDRVGVLPFAVPDRVTNPVRVSRAHQPLGVAFAGTWFAHKYPQRREQMRLLFDAALAVESPENQFDIYSRFLGGDEKYQFPQPYAEHVVGSLDYDRMLSAYRSYKVFLNVNTVTSSPTMMARRVLELVACGTPVVSTPAPSLARFLGDGVVQVDEPDAARAAIGGLLADPMERARLVHRGQRELWRAHTYGHRVDAVLDAVGLPNEPVRLPAVSVVVSTKRPQQVGFLLDRVAAQRDVDVELLVALHDVEAPDLVAQARERGLDRVTVVPMGADARLGDCLNALVDRASGAVVAKMDDDDWYGPDYLADLLRAMRFSDAEVVGKHCRFVHVAARHQTVLVQEPNEHRFTDFVAGPTLTARRDVLRRLPFLSVNRGEDSTFLERAVDAGVRIYAADRFSFVQLRSGRAGDHTWVQEDEAYLAQGSLVEGIPSVVCEA